MKSLSTKIVLGLMVVQVFFAAEAICAPAKALPKSFKLIGLKQESISASDLKNKVIVMQFWASWCKSCSTTMKTLDRATQGKNDVKFVTVSVDEDLKSAKGYFKNLPQNLKHLESKAYFDSDAKLASNLEVDALPTFMVINSSGQIMETFTGHPDKKDLSKLKKLMIEGRT